MRVNMYAGLEHYAEHMWPIWQALPDEVRGATWSPRHDLWWGNPPPAAMSAGPIMVAGYSDAVGGLTRGRDLVYVEHGAGQSYGGDELGATAAGLSGTTERGLAGVRLFLCPNETVANRWRAVHPAPAVVVGCPRLDSWHARMVSGSVLGEGGEGTGRLLDLDGLDGPERLRPGSYQPGATASAQGGLVDEPRRVAERGGPRVPQPGHDVSGRLHLPPSALREPRAPAQRDTEGEPGGVTTDGAGPLVQAGSRVHAREHLRDAGRQAPVQGVPPIPRAVAVTFHWDCTLIPETRSAWREYDPVLPDLLAWCRANDVELLGHGHPRLWSAIERRWRELGVEPVEHLADVFDRAGVLVADNTSAMFEFASLDKPVVAVNASWYRRDVEHGLRFWSHVPGRQVDEPGELVAAVALAVADPHDGHELRDAAAAAAYAHRDGHAAERAATAILEHLT